MRFRLPKKEHFVTHKIFLPALKCCVNGATTKFSLTFVGNSDLNSNFRCSPLFYPYQVCAVLLGALFAFLTVPRDGDRA